MQAQPTNLYTLLPQLQISDKAIFKYILINCYQNGQQIGVFVRGDKKFEFHSDNYDQFFKELKKAGFTELKKKEEKISGVRDGGRYEFVCPGGGRIEHNYDGKKCSVYGYSQSYGYVDHTIAQKIISQKLGYSLQEITLNQKDY